MKALQSLANLPIAYKLSILMVALLVLFSAVQGWLIASQQSVLLEGELHKFGHATTSQLVRQIKEPLLAQDKYSLERLVHSVVSDEGIEGVLVRDNHGDRLTLSGVEPQFTHVGEKFIHAWSDGDQQHYLSFVQIAYSNEVQIGEVIVTLNADVLEQIKRDATHSIIYSTLGMVLFGVVVVAWISTIVTKPIIRLVEISKRIAKGDYRDNFQESRQDELGALSESLNVMTSELLHKVHVEQSFNRYVSPKVAKEVLADLAPQELGGKEVMGSVLFADITGFTAISEAMTAAEVSKLLNDYFSYIDLACHCCNGHVDKYMGDCAMVLFGIPESDSDHTVNAIYCAVLIREVIERYNRERVKRGEATVRFHIGVNSGQMLAGNMGSRERMEYTVVGDTVNTAARLGSSSTDGEIAIT
ncbi:MAG: adenylate/guanylate cyclase domain-containing protein, partial [Chromatiales bacterium]|nr:adenylate/guanylate cyclase domain-containing protein [Chromatiales bacterium]